MSFTPILVSENGLHQVLHQFNDELRKVLRTSKNGGFKEALKTVKMRSFKR